jgi:hypothetical protein
MMALGILMIGSFLGFGLAVTAGLVFGLNFIAVLSVYAFSGVAVSLVAFVARGIWCTAARMRENYA